MQIHPLLLVSFHCPSSLIWANQTNSQAFARVLSSEIPSQHDVYLGSGSLRIPGWVIRISRDRQGTITSLQARISTLTSESWDIMVLVEELSSYSEYGGLVILALTHRRQ
ncbi:hypothetical protein BO78DRAFT_420367 [Aspergillus sclerotiicarbonarius CBS 121057]|uniref:Uncharacterized protein n=1 Tax=Aspergillus sclerotiicarbonarius (strain CBS 121057 / IBT 28362) TaxID=1448318 RepID=A0A319ELL9_ASPSB|nr:hypothetical protein BO78DRAFT_420367 [Aspergillus sclerotiicarbonarius CBS 121057]